MKKRVPKVLRTYSFSSHILSDVSLEMNLELSSSNASRGRQTDSVLGGLS